MVERSLSMREVGGSMPPFSTSSFSLFRISEQIAASEDSTATYFGVRGGFELPTCRQLYTALLTTNSQL